jgi:hypothetical protein
VFTTAQGLKIACVGGNFDEKLYESGEEVVCSLTACLL